MPGPARSPLPHRAAAPSPPSRRRSSLISVMVMRAPVHPSGCPKATAPPLTLTLTTSSEMPEVVDRGHGDRGERLVQLVQVESRRIEADLDGGLADGVDGCGSKDSGPAVAPQALKVASAGSPGSCALRGDISTSAAAPAEIGEELPAVMVPVSENTGFSRVSASMVESGRIPSSWPTTTGSPLRCGTPTGTTSPSNAPFFQAAAARAGRARQAHLVDGLRGDAERDAPLHSGGEAAGTPGPGQSDSGRPRPLAAIRSFACVDIRGDQLLLCPLALSRLRARDAAVTLGGRRACLTNH